MKAVVATPGIRNSVRLEEVDMPVPSSASQALLKVVEVGIDATDIEIAEGGYGEAPIGSDYLILGHECLAIVEESPNEISNITEGDLVVPTVRRPDNCLNCLNGESDMCLTGGYKEHGIKGLHGFAAEYAVSDADFLVKVPEELAQVAVLVEPMSVVEKGVAQSYKIQERMLWRPRRALILGTGPLGLLTTILLRLKELEVYTVATRSKYSLKAKLVERVGGIYVNSKEQPISSLGKFDLIIEATGVPSVAIEAQGMLNRNGTMCYLGIYRSKEQCQDIGRLYTDMVLGNQILFGSVNANRRYFEMASNDFREIERRFKGVLRDAISTVVAPADYMKAFKPGQEDIKSIIDFRRVE